MKTCTKCNQEKALTEFRPSKEGKFGRTSYCIKCLNEQVKQYCLENPWMRTFNNIHSRCTNPNIRSYNDYGLRGIKCLITPEELKELWFRDRAFEMKKPSIDRIDNDGDYCIENCRFMEKDDNTNKDRKKRILQFNLNGEFIKEWESSYKILKELNFSISRCLSGERKQSYNFIWKYKN